MGNLIGKPNYPERDRKWLGKKQAGVDLTSCQKSESGPLPDRKGQRGKGSHGRTQPDDESSQTLFGCPRQDWEQRMLEITSNWSEDERARRRVGELPNDEKQYGLRPEHHKDRGNDDWKIRRIP